MYADLQYTSTTLYLPAVLLAVVASVIAVVVEGGDAIVRVAVVVWSGNVNEIVGTSVVVAE